MQLFKKKIIKKRKYPALLLLDYECLTYDEKLESLSDIRSRLIKLFKNHIGKDNSTTPYNVFVMIFGIAPDSIDIFKRNYWWMLIKKILTELRTQGDLFVINSGHRLYVLQSTEELREFKKRINRHIEALEKTKDKATEWVNDEKWRNF